MADKVIENLITKLSFQFDGSKLKKFDAFIKSAVKSLSVMAVAATAAAGAVYAFTNKMAQANDKLGKLSQQIGIDSEALSELGYVAELNGGSVDSMNSSLEQLGRIASESARGMGAGVEVFGMLGVSVTDTNGRIKQTDALFNDVADALSRLGSQAERAEFAQKLGISGDILLSMQQGSDAINQQRQRARDLGLVLDSDATAAAARFNDAVLDQKSILGGLANTIGTKLMKVIAPMMEQFTTWYIANKKLIKQKLNAFIDKIIYGFQIVRNVAGRVVSMVMSLVNAMGGLKNAVVAVAGVLLVMNASALLMPILIAALTVGILLLLEDIIKYAEGGDSALGNLAKKFPVMDAALKGLVATFKMVRDGWGLIFTDGDDALEGFIMMIKDVGRYILDLIITPINSAIKLINKIPWINIKTIGSAEEPQFEQVTRKGIIRLNGKEGGNQNTTNINNSVVNNNSRSSKKGDITININGGDEDRVKRVVSDVLLQQYSNAQTNLATQVD